MAGKPEAEQKSFLSMLPPVRGEDGVRTLVEKSSSSRARRALRPRGNAVVNNSGIEPTIPSALREPGDGFVDGKSAAAGERD